MRDPNRIPRVLEALRQAWQRHPDWRFGQVVSNSLGAGPQDVFFPEDDTWEAAFNELAGIRTPSRRYEAKDGE